MTGHETRLTYRAAWRMSPKQKFNLLIEPAQLAVLQAIEAHTGARISEQIRRAIQTYIDNQTILTKSEVKA